VVSLTMKRRRVPIRGSMIASLLFGLCSWLVLLAGFLPGFLQNSVEVTLFVVLLMPSLIFWLLSIFNFIKKELDTAREDPVW
jgi:lipopolysaccharide export LptBFGC system permease protein LptF